MTHVLAPAPVLILLLLVVGADGGGAADAARGLAAAAVTVGVPTAVVLLGVRTGRFTDVHVRVREQRAVPLVVGVVCSLLGVALLDALGASRELVALDTAITAGLATGGLVTVWWKISGHTAVIGAATVVLTVLHGPLLFPLVAAALLTGWSRVALRDHTAAQVLAGFALGAGVTLAVFVPLGT